MKPSSRASSRAQYTVHILCVWAVIALHACSSKTDGVADQSPDTESPSAPAELSAHAASSSSIDLNWEAATDNVGVVAYRVYRSDAASFVASVTSTTYADTGLTAQTEYDYTVRAVDAAGNESAPSNAATIVTLSAATGEDVKQSTPEAVKPQSTVTSSEVSLNEYRPLKRFLRQFESRVTPRVAG